MSSPSPMIPVPMPAFTAFDGLGRPPAQPQTSRDIQAALVPLVSYHGSRMEAYGQTMPKDDVGGDLVDLVAAGRDPVAYVADVSGHGVRAALLMGMVKTAMRYGLHLGQPLTKLLDQMNCVLPAVKEAHMFATLAALRFDGTGEAEYISAGHVPLLHYQRRRQNVARYSMSQFPLGLFEDADYASCRIPYERGDLFLLVTDGVVETGDDRDADSGLEVLAQILMSFAERPLPEVFDVMRAAISGHGIEAHDDQTVLLLRAQ